tara:strand:+ start:1837 stop:1992 length:156 start_codon:yes stop_codon:yes gene_type:complete
MIILKATGLKSPKLKNNQNHKDKNVILLDRPYDGKRKKAKATNRQKPKKRG